MKLYRIIAIAALFLAVLLPEVAQAQEIPAIMMAMPVKTTAGGTNTTFDPSNALYNMALSSGNTVATAGTCSAFCAARGTSPVTHGGSDKVWFEVVVGVEPPTDVLIGIQNATYVPSTARQRHRT